MKAWIIATGIVLFLLGAGGIWWFSSRSASPENTAITVQSNPNGATELATVSENTEEKCSPPGTGTCDGNGRSITSSAPSSGASPTGTQSTLKTLTPEQAGVRVVTLTGAGSQGLDIDTETGLVYVGNQGSVTCTNTMGQNDRQAKGGDTLSIVDPSTGKETVNVATGVSPIWPLVDEKRGLVYVAGSGGTLNIHERVTGTKKKAIEIGPLPHAVGLSDDGIIVVSNTKDGSQKYYAVLNADSQTLITHHQAIEYPHSIAYHQEKNVFYMIGVEDGKIAIIDGKTGEPKTTFSGNEVNGNSAMIALAEKANKLFVGISEPKTGMNVIDLETQKIITTVTSDGNIPATSVAVDESRNLVFLLIPDKDMVQIIDAITYKSLATLAVGDCPFGVRLDTVRGLGFVTNQADHSLTMFDLNKVAQSLK